MRQRARGGGFGGGGFGGGGAFSDEVAPASMSLGEASQNEGKSQIRAQAKDKFAENEEAFGKNPFDTAGPGPDLGNVAARKNLNETAFFFPHLQVDDDGKGPYRI